MAKNKKLTQKVSDISSSSRPADPVIKDKGTPLLFSFRVQALFMALVCFIFYFNTFQNDYAVDDFLIIKNNAAINSGIAGIPRIMSSDVFETYYKQYNAENCLSGGRYRPLALVSYAIEQQILGQTTDPSDANIATKPTDDSDKKIIMVRHVDNLLLYILSVILLLYFLRTYIFPKQYLIAFLSVLLFAIHPVHTEVVANIKSRDEILSLLFITLTCIYAFRFKDDNKILSLIKALFCFFLALLAKEYVVTLIVLIPMMLYIFKGFSLPKSLKATLPYLAILVLYVALRFSVVSVKGSGEDDEILNNPYLLASPNQKIATEIATLLNYLKLLVFPYPLSADYSYNQVPYKNWGHPLVWLSIIVHGGLIAYMIRFFRKRHILSIAIAFYLFNLFLVSNLLFGIGATMGERLIYHSSFGFCMALAYFMNMGYERIKPLNTARVALIAVLSVIVLLCGVQTIARNADWKNNSTLYLKDVKNVPNSALANANAGAGCNEIANLPENSDNKKEILNRSIAYLDKAIAIHPKYTLAYMNRGTAYFELGDIERAKQDWDSVKKIYPSYPALPELYASYYINSAINKYGQAGNYAAAISELKKGTTVAPANAVLWYNLGYYYSLTGKNDSAIWAWQQIIKVAPGDTLAPRAVAAIKALTLKNAK